MTEKPKLPIEQWIGMQCLDAFHYAAGNLGQHKVPVLGWLLSLTPHEKVR
ncbi:MAG: hypothetical protein ACI9DC_001733 [Gammaproteobacteria bacterium]|jgi:hypothetical protein